MRPAAALWTAVAVAGATGAVLLLRRWAGLEGILIFGVVCVAAFWGWVLRWLYRDGRMTVSHILVIWLTASGTVMTAASYYLAYRGVTAVLETLSRYVMVETVAGSAGYFIKSALENTRRSGLGKRDL